MRLEKAMKKARRKIAKALPCPFCGNVPRFDIKVDPCHSSHGSIGHWAAREPCCKPTGTGQTELFFCNDWKPADYGLWKNMVDRLVNDWNLRVL